jgi:drug/metabolite transporter (DMT)-like permease
MHRRPGILLSGLRCIHVVKLVRNRKALQTTIFSIYFALVSATLGLLPHFKGKNQWILPLANRRVQALSFYPWLVLPFRLPFLHFAVISSVLGTSFSCTAGAYLLYFALIQSAGSLKAMTVNFLIPIFGIMWGVIFLREQVSLHLVIGLLIILSSVILVMDVRLTSYKEKKKIIS